MSEDLFSDKPAPRSAARLYADVVVRQRGRVVGTFTYEVPSSQKAEISLGQPVWVPFRQSRLPAVVVSLGEQSPEFDTKQIEGPIDARPVLTETQIQLGRWMADYYLCSLAEVLYAMLPPGLLHRTRTVVVLTAAGQRRSLEGLSQTSRQVIEALREAGEAGTEVSVSTLARALNRRSLSSIPARLAQRGWLELRTQVEEPAAQPHFESFLVLSAPPDQVRACRERLWAGRRNSAPARVLEALARATGGTRDKKGLARELKVSRRTLTALEEAGLVRVEPEQRTLRLTATEAQVSGFLAERGRRAPQQAALLEQLRETGGGLDLNQVTISTGPRRALERRGLIREQIRPERVRLTVLPEVALERAAALRRTRSDERQAGILDALEQAPGRALPLSVLYETAPEAGRQDASALVEAGVCREEEREILRDPLAAQEFPLETPPPLTEQQGSVWREIYDAFGTGGSHVFLLHGVTGSGKTEIYLRALGRTLREGRQAIVLVPEISLTPQTVRRFAARFPGRVTVLHSGLTLGERYDQWRRVRDGRVDVIVGPRSALFAPLPRLGLIVLDEEHENSYKQDDLDPRYHARETALALARITGSIVILGSATPAVESYTMALRRQFRLLELPDRIRVRESPSGARQAIVDASMPRVEIVDMRQELHAGNLSMFSRSLQQALKETLAAHEQAILFLNRRGAATFVMCRECGYVAGCSRCEVPLVYHAERQRLICHRCGRQIRSPQLCPECGSRRIRHFGAGTERVVTEVLQLFPRARALRCDSDATRDRGAHQQIMDSFVQHRADLLVGTQMVAKGLDLPLVTLVGVISADTALHLPDFRAAERTYQLVTQVIGRAGRREERGRAIIQTYHPEHYAIRAAARQDYGAFYRQELAFRRSHGYPPLQQMARLVYGHSQEWRCQEEALRVASLLMERTRVQPDARLIGPAPAFVSKLRGQYRWHVLVLAEDVHPILTGLELSAGWSVDVDPISLLA